MGFGAGGMSFAPCRSVGVGCLALALGSTARHRPAVVAFDRHAFGDDPVGHCPVDHDPVCDDTVGHCPADHDPFSHDAFRHHAFGQHVPGQQPNGRQPAGHQASERHTPDLEAAHCLSGARSARSARGEGSDNTDWTGRLSEARS